MLKLTVDRHNPAFNSHAAAAYGHAGSNGTVHCCIANFTDAHEVQCIASMHASMHTNTMELLQQQQNSMRSNTMELLRASRPGPPQLMPVPQQMPVPPGLPPPARVPPPAGRQDICKYTHTHICMRPSEASSETYDQIIHICMRPIHDFITHTNDATHGIIISMIMKKRGCQRCRASWIAEGCCSSWLRCRMAYEAAFGAS